jgi:hypothetical protein
MMEMNRSMLPLSQLDYVLSEELKHEYVTNGGDLLDVLNAKVKVDILAGSKMQTRRVMAQALPQLTQFLSGPSITEQLAIQAKKVDIVEIIRLWFEMAELRNMRDVVVDMSEDDKQRHQQMAQGGIQQQKFLQQQALQAQKAAQAEQLADSENIARASRDALRLGWKASVEPEELQGEPNATQGFGSQI